MNVGVLDTTLSTTEAGAPTLSCLHFTLDSGSNHVMLGGSVRVGSKDSSLMAN